MVHSCSFYIYNCIYIYIIVHIYIIIYMEVSIVMGVPQKLEYVFFRENPWQEATPTFDVKATLVVFSAPEGSRCPKGW